MVRLTSLLSKLFLSVVILSGFTTNASEQTQIRKAFLQAEKQVWQANSRSYKNLYQQLHYYPLQPYLDQQRLIHSMRLSSAKEISLFLDKYENTPLDWPLRKKWLNYLAKNKKPLLFRSFFKPTTDTELTCLFYNYELNAGVDDHVILPKITALWVVGKSQPKACDPLFERWQNSGYQTEQVIWQRLSLAADGGKHTLIPYLTKLLSAEQRYLGALWHKVRKDPGYITRTSRFPNKNTKEATIASYGLKRLIWRDPDRAIKAYKELADILPFSSMQKKKITLKFAVALASKNHSQAKPWLAQVDKQYITGNIAQWLIADLLRLQDWQAIKTKLLTLPETYQSKHQWQYWYGRSLLETNEIAQGTETLAKLAEQRHYYGFLAASSLQQPVNLQDNPLNITEQEKSGISEQPAAKRAFEFFYLNRFIEARREWNYWLSNLSQREKLVAAKIANEAGWYDRAIFTLSKVGYLDDVDLRFPLAFDEEITHYADNHKINPAWAFAITRRESSFMSDANSPAGARGLMQIMPATAKQLNRRRVSKKNLLNAEKNIDLGTKYLKRLLDRYDGNQVLATASYNAGPYRVKKWLNNAPTLPADIWIETIPYKETREYVKSVMAYQQIYQLKVGQTVSLFDQLVNMDITR